MSKCEKNIWLLQSSLFPLRQPYSFFIMLFILLNYQIAHYIYVFRIYVSSRASHDLSTFKPLWIKNNLIHKGQKQNQYLNPVAVLGDMHLPLLYHYIATNLLKTFSPQSQLLASGAYFDYFDFNFLPSNVKMNKELNYHTRWPIDNVQ